MLVKIRKFFRTDNKGNTLGVVLIGIFILSILGTLILGVTATNFNMKLNEKNSQTVFYNAEKAIDAIYAGIGKEVMDKVDDSYTYSLERYSENKSLLAIPTVQDSANVTYKKEVRKELTAAFQDGTLVNVVSDPASYTTIKDEILGKLKGYVSELNKSTKYKYTIYPSSGNISISYQKLDPTSGAYVDLTHSDKIENVDKIIIKNVGVKCEIKKRKYSASIASDFEIKVPDMNLDFHDSPISTTLLDLGKYSFVCEGYNLSPEAIILNDRQISPIMIADGSTVNIKGNMYADGTIYTAVEKHTPVKNVQYYVKNEASVLAKNPSVTIGNNATLNVNSKVFYCKNDFVLNNKSNAVMSNESGTNESDTTNSLQFYANNIKTLQNTSDAKFYFLGGNCIVKDDLEINGDNSEVNISGNYIGYGFRDNNRDGVEDDTAAVNAFTSGLVDTNKEHEKSSAIIVNGKNALVNMNGGVSVAGSTTSALKNLVLLGRAYIDLDGTNTNTSYMTGESASFKGNQNIYLASSNKVGELAGNKYVLTNPISQTELVKNLGVSSINDVTYEALGLDSNNVVAKNSPLGDQKIYFYVKNSNPVAQTNYVKSMFAANADATDKQKITDMTTQLGSAGLNVRGFILPYRGLGYYLLGNVMTVQRSGESVYISNPVSGNSANLSGLNGNLNNFVNIINNRTSNLQSTLKDLSEKNVLLQSGTNYSTYREDSPESTGTSPYDYYIDREKLLDATATGSGRKTIQLDIQNLGTDANSNIYDVSSEEAKKLNQELKTILINSGVLKSDLSNAGGLKIGVTISNEPGISRSPLELDAGVVVGEKSYQVNKNFSGLILNNDSMEINGNVTISANPELTEFMFKNVKDLRNLLSDKIVIVNTADTGDVVDSGSVAYTDIVSKENWRRE